MVRKECKATPTSDQDEIQEIDLFTERNRSVGGRDTELLRNQQQQTLPLILAQGAEEIKELLRDCKESYETTMTTCIKNRDAFTEQWLLELYEATTEKANQKFGTGWEASVVLRHRPQHVYKKQLHGDLETSFEAHRLRNRNKITDVNEVKSASSSARAIENIATGGRVAINVACAITKGVVAGAGTIAGKAVQGAGKAITFAGGVTENVGDFTTHSSTKLGRSSLSTLKNPKVP